MKDPINDRTFDPDYIALVQQLQVLFVLWVQRESQTRLVHLTFYEWRGVVYGAALQGNALELLCGSKDAREMCEWADAQTGGKATLLQALCAAELCGYKQPGRGPSIPPEVTAKIRGIRMAAGGQA